MLKLFFYIVIILKKDTFYCISEVNENQTPNFSTVVYKSTQTVPTWNHELCCFRYRL